MAESLPVVAEMVYSLLQRQETLGTGMGKKLTLNSSLMEELSRALAYEASRHVRSSDLDVLNQLCQAIKVLRIYSSNVNLAHECLDVSGFLNISVLELLNVCVDQVKGLSKLRAYLKRLVCQSGLSNLESLFIHCGADHCADCFLWSELTEAIFTRHEHLYLGEAFKLTPWLKYLDLSKNNLTSHEIQSLSHLSHLTQLNLSYNRLLNVPHLSPSASHNLQSLFLRYNQLDSLQGLECLISLQELDASYNCIATFESLVFLGNLPKLRRLCLERNPIAFHSSHRFLIVRLLSPCIPKDKFCLDRKALSRTELSQLGTNSRTIPLVSRVLAIPASPPVAPPPLPALIQSVLQPTTPSPPCASSIQVISSTPKPPAPPVREDSIETVQSPPKSLEIAITQAELNPPPPRISPISEDYRTLDSTSVGSRKLKRGSSVKKHRSRVRIAEIADVNDETTDSLLSTPVTHDSEASLGDATKQKLQELVATFGAGDWLHSQGARELSQLLGWKGKTAKEKGFLSYNDEEAGLADEISLLKSLEHELFKLGPRNPPAALPSSEAFSAQQKFDDDVIVLERENTAVEVQEPREGSVVVLTVEKQGRSREEDRESDIEVVADKEHAPRPTFIIGSSLDEFSQSTNGQKPPLSFKTTKTDSVSSPSIQSCTISTQSSADSGLASITYSYVDFSQVDHRVRLYCEMSLMTGRGEEFLGVLKASLVSLSGTNPEEPVLLVLTSHKVYFLKIVGAESEVVEKWLQKLTSYPLSSLKSVLLTYRNQAFGLQFKDESYLLILRDERRTKNFIQFLQDGLARSGYRLQTEDVSQIVKPNLVLSIAEGELTEEEDGREAELLLLRAFHYSADGRNVIKQGKLDVAVVCDKEQLYLVQSDVRWLVTKDIHPLKVCQNSIANLVTIASSTSQGGKLRLDFMDDVSGSEEEWILTFATSDAAWRLIEAIREPWEAVFSVDLQVVEEDF